MLWDVESAERTGPSHKVKGEGSQDRFAYRSVGDFLLVAVADGAGSRSRSAEGAEIAVNSALDYLDEAISSGEDPTELLVSEAIYEARDAVLEDPNHEEMGCTLAIAVVSESMWAAAVLGDSFVVVHEAPDRHFLIQPVRKSEFANVTELLTSDVINPVSSSGDWAPFGVSVSSDGLLHLSVKDRDPAAGFWGPLLERAKANTLNLDSFLGFLENRDLLDDDTTLVMAVRRDS